MNHKKTRFNAVVTALMCNGFLTLISFYKISYIVGSLGAFFNASAIILPLSGAWSGMRGVCATFGVRLFLALLVSKFSYASLHVLAFYVPGLFAGLYWTSSHWSIRLAPAAFCMIAFIAHPTGFHAALYAALWIIPFVVYWYDKNNIFLKALGSTFTAHAIGSVIWLYTMPLSAEAWLALIPVALLERCAFATAMVVVYHAVNKGYSVVSSYSSSFPIAASTSTK